MTFHFIQCVHWSDSSFHACVGPPDACGFAAIDDDVPCPEPILLSEEDFENSIWEVQVEKNGNWFSGNYVPDSFKMAISNNENQTCEYAGESTTKGKWYMDSTSFYFERRPLGFLGPINPGMEYFRASLTGWTNDENTGDRLQTAGYVSVLYLCGGRVTRLCLVCPYPALCVA